MLKSSAFASQQNSFEMSWLLTPFKMEFETDYTYVIVWLYYFSGKRCAKSKKSNNSEKAEIINTEFSTDLRLR